MGVEELVAVLAVQELRHLGAPLRSGECPTSLSESLHVHHVFLSCARRPGQLIR